MLFWILGFALSVLNMAFADSAVNYDRLPFLKKLPDLKITLDGASEKGSSKSKQKPLVFDLQVDRELELNVQMPSYVALFEVKGLENKLLQHKKLNTRASNRWKYMNALPVGSQLKWQGVFYLCSKKSAQKTCRQQSYVQGVEVVRLADLPSQSSAQNQIKISVSEFTHK